MYKKNCMLILVLIAMVLMVSVALTGCGTERAAQQPAPAPTPAQPKQVVAKFAHVGSPDHIFEIGARKFSDLVLEKTKGQIKIDTYPGGQLGGDRDVFEGIRIGTIEFALVGAIDNFLPIQSVVSLPFFFKSPEHVYKFLDGPLGKQIYGGLNDMGIVYLGSMENGWRLITSNKPINSIADLRGMKIRVPQSPNFVNTFTALGASPTPIAFTELYAALQNRVVDGQENPVFHIMTQRFYEVQKYVALTSHIYLDAPMLVSRRFWQGLTTEQQKAVQDAAVEAINYQRKYAQDKQAEMLKDLQAKGVTLTKPDLAPFREAVKPLHEEWAKKFGKDLFDQIVALGN